MWRTGASLAAIAVVSLIADSARAQGMDGGPQPSRSVEFEGSPPGRTRQSAMAQGTLSDQQRRALRAELDRITIQLRETDMLLAGLNRGEFLVGTPGMLVTMSRQDIARYVAEGRVTLTDPNDPLNILGLDGSPQSKVEHLVRLAAERSQVLAAGLREKRQALWARRDQIMRALDADRRAAMAGVRPGDAYNPNTDYRVAPVPDISGPWMGNYNRGLVNNIVQSGDRFSIALPEIGVNATGLVRGQTIQMTSTGRVPGSFTGQISFDANGRAVQIRWSNGDVWVRR